MKKFLFLLMMIFAFPTLLLAQDQTDQPQPQPQTCTIDLSAVQDLLTQAQGQAGTAALALVVEAREGLLKIEQDCASAGVILLDQSYSAPDASFSVSYPHGWSVGTYTPSETGGVLFLGNSAFADRLLQLQEPQIAPGEQAIQLLVGTPEATRQGDPLENVISDFESLINALYQDVSTTEYYTLDDRRAARLSFRGGGFDGVVVGIEVGDGRFAVARGIAAAGGLSSITATARSIVASVI